MNYWSSRNFFQTLFWAGVYIGLWCRPVNDFLLNFGRCFLGLCCRGELVHKEFWFIGWQTCCCFVCLLGLWCFASGSLLKWDGPNLCHNQPGIMENSSEMWTNLERKFRLERKSFKKKGESRCTVGSDYRNKVSRKRAISVSAIEFQWEMQWDGVGYFFLSC